MGSIFPRYKWASVQGELFWNLSSILTHLVCLSIYFKYSLPNNLRIQAIPAALGVSASKQYHVNSLAVPRKAKEAIGGITRLTHSDGKLTISSLTDKENNADSGLMLLMWMRIIRLLFVHVSVGCNCSLTCKVI